MSIEVKIIIFWIAFVIAMWICAKVHYMLSDSRLNWKHFIEDYSSFGLAYCISLYFGKWALAGYLVDKILIWWVTLKV